MKKLSLIILVLFLAGCRTVPVTPDFPTAPELLLEQCPTLKTLGPDAKLSTLMLTITENYMLYHDCARKNKAWNEWYTEQKAIYEKAGKK